MSPETVVLMTVQGSPLDTSLNHNEIAAGMQTGTANVNRIWALRPFPPKLFCVTLLPMGNKDKGKKEVKKAPKPKLKPEPGRKREIFTPAPPK